MTESVSAMDSSDEEEYYDASDSFPDPCCEEGKNTPAPESEHVPPPGEVLVLDSDQDTVSLGFPPTENSAGFRLQLDYSCETHRGCLTVDDSSPVKVDGLIPGTEYTFSITRIADNGNQSKATSLSVFTEPSPPVQITVDQVSSESLSLHWDPPAGEVESYIVTCCSDGDIMKETTDTNKMTFSNLKPGESYFLEVSTKLRNGRISRPTVTSANTNVPPPGEVTVVDSDQDTVSLGFPPTENSAGFRLQLDYSCETHRGSLTVDDSSPVKVDGLIPGTEYTFSITRIADNGNQSKATLLSVFTEPSPPVQITVDQVSSESLSLHWEPPAGEVESYIVTCCSEGDIMKETTDTNKMTFSNLKPGESYFLEVSTKLRNGRISRPTVTSANTNVPPPGEVTVVDSDQDTVSLGFPPTENSAGFRLQLDYSCETHRGSLTVDDSSPVKVDGLIPGTEYTFSITRIADNGNQSKATLLSVFTEPSPPVQITVDQVSSESLSLHWEPPAGEVESYIVTCCSEGDIMKETTDTNKMTFSNLKPGESYFLEVSTKLRNGRISRPTVTSANTNVPPPGEVTVVDSDQDTVSLGFPPTENSAGFRLQLDYSCETHRGSLTVDDSSPVKVYGLIPGTEYTFSITRIADNGNQSKATSLSVFTEPSPPVQITVDQVSSESLSLHWDPPAGEVESYIVTCCSEGDIMKETTDTNKMTFSNLKPGESYFLEVSTKLRNGRISRPTVTSANTNVPPPGEVTVVDSDQDTVSLGFPPTENSAGFRLQLDYSCESHSGSLTVDDSSPVKVDGLIPGTEYTFSITRIADNGNQSKATSLSVFTEPSPPVQITVDQVSSESLSLHWDPPAGEVESYIVTCCSEGDIMKETTDTNKMTFSNLKPGESYFLEVSTKLRNGRISRPTVTSANTNVPPPGEVTVVDSDQDTVSLGFPPTENSAGFRLQLDYSCETHSGSLTVDDSSPVKVDGLIPGTEYTFSITRIADNGNQSKATSLSVFTEPSPPVQITVDQVSSESLSLHWDPPAGEVESYIVTCCSDGDIMKETTDTNKMTFSNLKPGESYFLEVSTKLRNGRISRPTVTSANTKTHLESFLEELGLDHHYKEKLSLITLLRIEEKTITDEPAKCNSDLPWYFLKKLMMVNVTARNVKCPISHDDHTYDLDNLDESSISGDILNPLDIVTALFLCSDGFVQQEMALKMSMCQFSVPLLLPNCDTKQCTLMLWAMRDIVKKYRPPSLSESKGFIEERIVVSELPMISFVRLGECSLSKSEILNKLLSNSQQYHDTFVHSNMEGGDSPRRISNGLVEMTWYLPCGNENMDVFSEPVAVANLRGDIASFETQFAFLCQTSAAVFVFFDALDSECELLTNQNHKAQIFLVGNRQNQGFSVDSVKKVKNKLVLTDSNILLKTKRMNDAEFVNILRKKISNVIQNSKMKMGIEKMSDIAHELGIWVDEDSPECQNGKKNADAITAEIQDILKYKEVQLPLQGQIWKDLTRLEKEEFRLRKVGSENIEKYKSDLQQQKKQLRKKQNSFDGSKAMTCFIKAISSPGMERCYFLKWLRMNLDNVSREKLCDLREQYKEKCKNSENKEEIKEIDQQLSNSSLGTEHFFREMGQIYEASLSLPETEPARQQLQHLPKLCAELMLAGFPLELVDGEASNIPIGWVTDVLSQLNDLVSPKNKILVVTVLGVQSTGKSTLLNTMFGVQFAVSSGRCTRGAFMLLIKINEDVRKDFNCDFMVIIDTEGLKSPELAQLDQSHEHDNELATLVVGLSDITIINVAMENSTEMKDILQIVVHAFLRMKEVSKKKPKCQFVHQNVSDVSAHDKNLRDRKLLLQQLNEMTQAAAKMEKKEEYSSFTDVMEYSPDTGNWYIPGLWNGNPPMAPVNAGYSEAVYELKKNIIHILGSCGSSANNILEFTEWMKSLWTAVKHENFIFSFRNSLVADAYMRLCKEFNKWEWDFKKEMYTWVTKAETVISNFGTPADKSNISEMIELIMLLKNEALTELSKWETKLLGNLEQYFKQTLGHVYLVEGYRQEFANSAKSLRQEMEISVKSKLTAAAEIRKGMAKLDKLKEEHTKELEGRVCVLIEECRKKKVQMTDKELDKEFEKMWTKTVKELSFTKMKVEDIFTSVSHRLRTNLSTKGSHVSDLLSQKSLKECGQDIFKYKPQGTIEWLKSLFSAPSHTKAVQKIAAGIIKVCSQFVTDKVQRKGDYHETYIDEILKTIDESLQNNHNVGTDITFEVSLKQHICGDAARRFQKMHEDFLHEKDPYICLKKNKGKFLADFKDVFHNVDQCQKKAGEFTDLCLKPAVEYFVNRSLGPDIIGEMRTSEEFSTRMSFQYSVLLDLLPKGDFKKYQSFISSYEKYVKEWIFNKIVRHFSNGSTMFEEQHLQSCVNSINNAIQKAKTEKSGNLKSFVVVVCKELGDKLVISQDALGAFMILNKANQEQFARWLTECVTEMAQTLREKFKKTDIQTKLQSLHVNPQDELFNTLIGCGEQCPFCKAPCEAGGTAHTEHFASLHRPEGLGKYRWSNTKKLCIDICSSLVNSDITFHCRDTNDQSHPYKGYKEIYPDWKIQADASLQASDYWKYVMAKFNNEFAPAYDAKPADIPDAWKEITPEQAEASLKESFHIK
ncbi:interferon-induced very large GTPase 1-like isoform X3 [Gymnodraco acuticeps]|uniref:Interferon-induced very large GTPase 1-like isoform X3 n=1 Tax=Gymnodraco acuticeps TaxID=8218 RepID=A0A6P8UH06_GYMAC|nr:interferon-induced very large GTPase 1-like isoform X3 [Gymnodraco acuticeps]